MVETNQILSSEIEIIQARFWAKSYIANQENIWYKSNDYLNRIWTIWYLLY